MGRERITSSSLHLGSIQLIFEGELKLDTYLIIFLAYFTIRQERDVEDLEGPKTKPKTPQPKRSEKNLDKRRDIGSLFKGEKDSIGLNPKQCWFFEVEYIPTK